MIVELLTRNNKKAAMKDVTFYCKQVAKSGTVLYVNEKIIYDIWQPGDEKKVRLEFSKHNQMSKLVCFAK